MSAKLTDIHITLGGERIYVLPIAWDDSVASPTKNRIFYFDSLEFPPKPNDLLIENIDSIALCYADLNRRNTWCFTFKYLWYKFAKRLLVALGRSIKVAFKYKTSLWSLGWYCRTGVPFIAHEVYNYKGLPWHFSIPHHPLIVQDQNDLYTDDYYLNPSQRFLGRELQKLLEKDLDSIGQPDIDVARHFIAWRERMRAKGLKVSYIASLDT